MRVLQRAGGNSREDAHVPSTRSCGVQARRSHSGRAARLQALLFTGGSSLPPPRALPAGAVSPDRVLQGTVSCGWPPQPSALDSRSRHLALGGMPCSRHAPMQTPPEHTILLSSYPRHFVRQAKNSSQSRSKIRPRDLPKAGVRQRSLMESRTSFPIRGLEISGDEETSGSHS